jgi:CheY-like chemotaxis protein
MQLAGLRPPRLLVCDDSPVERLALCHLLRATGYLVDEASDGKAAIEYLRSVPVDALVLDLMLPVLDGFEVLEHLRKHRPELPVVLMSGMTPDEIQHRMQRAHTELPPLLLKPIELDQLVAILNLQLSGEIAADGSVRQDPGSCGEPNPSSPA